MSGSPSVVGCGLLFTFVATLCAGAFFGAAFYIGRVQQPAVQELGRDVATRLFAPMYRRAAPIQAGFALVGATAAVLAWLGGEGVAWLAGGLLLASVVPLTLIAIRPVNEQLLDPERDPHSAETGALLDRWATLHGFRSLLSGAAFAVFAAALALA